MAKITIFTDGSSKGNPGKGGYGIVLISGNYRKQLSEGFRFTTNNRMELLAVIEGLKAIKNMDHEIVIYSDSKYVVDSIKKGWIYNWQKKNFTGKKNKDLWKEFLKLKETHKNIEFIWIKGHANIRENEICDKLAVEASNKANLKIDRPFEESIKIKNPNSKILF